MNRLEHGVCLLALLCGFTVPATAQRQLERLDRGLVAIHEGQGKVFVSWRLLASDPPGVAFNVYRAGGGEPVRLNPEPFAGPTHWIDTAAPLNQPLAYTVRPILDGKEGDASQPIEIKPGTEPRPYLSVPLQTPDGYTPSDASVGDLDGDGQYEIVLHQVGRGRDNSQRGQTSEPILQAYCLDGRLLWTINLGRNIREGAHYTQFMVYDLDGDGRAEVACKTADGTVDGQGKTIGDPAADHRNAAGYVLEGPEFLSVFDGPTGAALATVDYIPPRGDVAAWGDNYGNRVDRFLACIAYLDGRRPSLVMCRGYYTRAVLAAWDWRDGKLTQRWVFDSDDGTQGNRAYRGQGNHSLAVADVDGDGREEIVYGSATIDDDGRGLYSTGLGHGDALHVADLDPARPGLEVWAIHENERGQPRRPGATLRSAASGEARFAALAGRDVGRGLAADIDPRHPGAELWTNNGGLWNAKGQEIGSRPRSCNMAIWWDGDLQRELLSGVDIAKWDYAAGRETPLLVGREFGVASNNGSKQNPCLSADILGDWREELVARTRDGRELRIFTTTIPTEHRLVTLMHDPQYRLGVAWQNVAYNQPPHLSYFPK